MLTCDHTTELLTVHKIMMEAVTAAFVQSVDRMQENGNTCKASVRESIRLLASIAMSPVLSDASPAMTAKMLAQVISLAKADPDCRDDVQILLAAHARKQQIDQQEAEQEGLVNADQDFRSLNFEATAIPKK